MNETVIILSYKSQCENHFRLVIFELSSEVQSKYFVSPCIYPSSTVQDCNEAKYNYSDHNASGD